MLDDEITSNSLHFQGNSIFVLVGSIFNGKQRYCYAEYFSMYYHYGVNLHNTCFPTKSE